MRGDAVETRRNQSAGRCVIYSGRMNIGRRQPVLCLQKREGIGRRLSLSIKIAYFCDAQNKDKLLERNSLSASRCSR